MIKKLLVSTLVLPALVIAQNTHYSENFQTGASLQSLGYTLYNDTNTPYGTYAPLFGSNAWISVLWSEEGTNRTASTTSYFTTNTPADRWMITPAITIPANATEANLSFKARTHDSSPFDDGFVLKISVTDVQKASFTTTLLTVPHAPFASLSTIAPTTVNLSAYRGKTIYLAWVNTYTEGSVLSVDNITVTSNGMLSAEEVKERSASVVYPNPATDSFEIGNSSDVLSVAMYDALGKMVKKYGNQEKYDVSDLGSGVYRVVIKRNSGTETKTIIKK
jgi:hypothetical protein